MNMRYGTRNSMFKSLFEKSSRKVAKFRQVRKVVIYHLFHSQIISELSDIFEG